MSSVSRNYSSAASSNRSHAQRTELDNAWRQLTDDCTKALASRMKQYDDLQKRYICFEDVRFVWSNAKLRSSLRASIKDSDETKVDYILYHSSLIISCLIWIDCKICVQELMARLFKHDSLRYTNKDMPLNKEKIAEFLRGARPRDDFYERQFIFTPQIIEFHESQHTQTFNELLRLPFEVEEKDHLGSGGFGDVDRVVVSEGYIRDYRIKGGIRYTMRFSVARKRLYQNSSFRDERKNLEILKESLTEHKSIMLHLATIEHGPNFYILLPYANRYDLDMFLHGGYRQPEDELVYVFDRVFPNVADSDVGVQLLTQCCNLADALKTLHVGFRLRHGGGTMRCVHLDLKPNNILIEDDPSGQSIVGQWKISDFGISVIDSAKKNGRSVVSVRDFAARVTPNQVTMNIETEQRKGTWAAPEINPDSSHFGDPGHSDDSGESVKHGIGRKCDIWSFGCILAEVLAFNQGRKLGVKQFTIDRLGREEKDDYFYEPISTDNVHLALPRQRGQKTSFRVKNSVINWLERIAQVPSPSNWVSCFTQTIVEILVIDPRVRPDATQLCQDLDHVHDHASRSRFGGSVGHCPHQKTRSQSSNATHVPMQPTSAPSVHIEEYIGPAPQPSFPHLRQRGVESDSNVVRDQATVLAASVSGYNATNTGNFDNISSSRPIQAPRHIASIPDLEHTDSTRPFSTTSSGIQINLSNSSIDVLNRSTNYQPPLNHHGIFHQAERTRTISRHSTLHLPVPSETETIVIDIAVNGSWHLPQGPNAAYLVKSQGRRKLKTIKWPFVTRPRPEWSIDILHIDLSIGTVQRAISLPLGSDIEWHQVIFAGRFAAVYTIDQIHNMVYIQNIERPKGGVAIDDNVTDLGTLKKVVLSQSGLAGLLCHGVIHLVDSSTGQLQIHPLYPHGRYSILTLTDLAFDDKGEFLYCWSCGSDQRWLHVWRCERRSNGSIAVDIQVQSPYSIDQQHLDHNATTLIPYNSFMGCIIAGPEQQYFPAQLRGTLSSMLSDSHKVEIKHSLDSKLFQNCSLVTLKKAPGHRPVLKEYPLMWESKHRLSEDPLTICELHGRVNERSKLHIVSKDMDIYVLIYNFDLTVEVVHLKATSTA